MKLNHPTGFTVLNPSGFFYSVFFWLPVILFCSQLLLDNIFRNELFLFKKPPEVSYMNYITVNIICFGCFPMKFYAIDLS